MEAGDTSLDALGLRPGEPVRWRRHDGGHWQEGTVIRRERDGSVAVHDAEGAWRSLRIDRLEVQTRGRRGAERWEPLPERAARPRQLGLWD